MAGSQQDKMEWSYLVCDFLFPPFSQNISLIPSSLFPSPPQPIGLTRYNNTSSVPSDLLYHRSLNPCVNRINGAKHLHPCKQKEQRAGGEVTTAEFLKLQYRYFPRHSIIL